MIVRLGSRDLDRSAAFYRDLLGFGEVPAPAPGARCFAAGSVRILVTEVAPGADLGGWVDDDRQGGIRHFGLKVADVDARIRDLSAAGVTVLSPPADVLGGVRIAFFLDPDGARLEFVQGNLTYQHVYAPDLAAAEAATRIGPGERPRFDHVAVTVEDLPAALDRFGCPVIGQIRHHGDPRGFLMTYLLAGPAVLEVFSFDVPVRPRPLEMDGVLGFHGIDL
ncbi:VOC family protein [Phytohabitans sp. ZYX-F-186]|uniref:VOC family protein n=1 Tax=Phytohabitans maris TaxID=3071409 RepID=A0ABU0Z9X4_9ACTN|nr:VOC family protein [Phytohabitans sp. ZYX-F-186]MDQ7903835.1 VOC family protein [Phytohabitans sp. ZYX-F-186]